MIQSREENGRPVIQLIGEMDPSNAPQVEQQIRGICQTSACSAVEADCDRLR